MCLATLGIHSHCCIQEVDSDTNLSRATSRFVNGPKCQILGMNVMKECYILCKYSPHCLRPLQSFRLDWNFFLFFFLHHFKRVYSLKKQKNTYPHIQVHTQTHMHMHKFRHRYLHTVLNPVHKHYFVPIIEHTSY